MTSLRTLRSATTRVVAPAAAAAVALVAFAGTASAAETMTFVEGNPSCPANTTEYKIDAEPTVKGYTIGDFTVDITKSADGTVSFANASKDIVAVIMKGGPNANVYAYDPAVRADDDLVTPTNPNNDKRYGTSHVTFCSGTTTPAQNQNTPTPDTPTVNTPAAPTPEVAAAVQSTTAPAAAQVLGVQVEREAAPQVLGAQLAATGIDTTTMAVVGITLVGIGAALLPVTRRRRTSDAG